MMVMEEADEESVVSSGARRGSQGAANHLEQLQKQRSGVINRVCSSCSTTKTPLWRSGPQGPKSLCNACGIRRRKERSAARATAAAAAAASSSDGRSSRGEETPKASRESFLPFRKRCKNLGFDDTAGLSMSLSLSLSNNSSSSSSSSDNNLHQDERDAAILLMSLSCGLIHG